MRNIILSLMKSISTRKITLLLASILCFAANGYSQDIGIKTNALYWATTTPNIGAEMAVGRKWTVDLSGGYNPWEFGDNKKIKHWVAQSELRYWLCDAFEGHFFGLHAQGGEFNVGGVRLPNFMFDRDSENHRYQGFFVGAGISYGYQWILSPRWNLEANIGFGYNYMKYDKFEKCDCGDHLGNETSNYFGPTKIGISFIYLIK